MIRSIFLGLCFGLVQLFSTDLLAQKNQVPSNGPLPKTNFVEKNDPEAVKTLNKLRDKFKSFKSTKVDYVLTIEAGTNKEVQQGKLQQKGKKFKANTNGNEMLCDGKTVWMYLKKQNEVQITTYDESDEDMLSPTKMLDFQYLDKKFLYVVTEDDASSQHIEFKPTERESDYSKMRMKVLKSKNEVEHIKIFMKDGSRYSLDIKKIESADIPDSVFLFDETKYPNVRKTDLRD
jgi:outer membrane lipoprotein carrier protein